jgi:uncharacterized membrane protein YccC
MLQATLNQPPWRPKEGEAATHHTARKAEKTSTPRRQRERTAANSLPPPRPARSSTPDAPRAAPHLLLATTAGREKRSATEHHHPGARKNTALFKENLLPTPHTASGSHLESTAARRAESSSARSDRRDLGASSGEKRHLQAQRLATTKGDLDYGAGTSPLPLSTGIAGESGVGSGRLSSVLSRVL